MSEKLIEDLKKLLSECNELGDSYYREAKAAIVMTDGYEVSGKSDAYYRCAERLRAVLLRHGINLE